MIFQKVIKFNIFLQNKIINYVYMKFVNDLRLKFSSSLFKKIVELWIIEKIGITHILASAGELKVDFTILQMTLYRYIQR